jgi:hypothetical protein
MPHPAAIRPDGDEDLTQLDWQVYYLRLQADDIRQEVDWLVGFLRGQEKKDIVATGVTVIADGQPAPTAPGPTEPGKP